MSNNHDLITALRETVRLSPENVALRKHLADQLLIEGAHGDAEQEYRQALSIAPNDMAIKESLARAFIAQKKFSMATVIVEELLEQPYPSTELLMLGADLFAKTDDRKQAKECYEQAIQLDPSLANENLEESLTPAPSGDKELVHVLADEDIPDSIDALLESSQISFKDVGGMQNVKEEIELKIIHPLNHPEIYEAYGKRIGGGILLYGPPGCGKTHLARATAGEVKASFVSVGIHDVLNMYMGQSEQNLHGIFEVARYNTPSVLFFDEVDALGAKRSDMQRSAGRQMVNQFLSEMDGIDASNDGVLILAATNAPWHLDTAFRRPGRFDRVLFVPPPDTEARAAILEILLQGKPIDDISYELLAKKTVDFSGADLKALVDVAIEGKLTAAIKAGKPSPLSTKDLQKAAKRIKPTVKEWFATARNHALYSNQTGIYDDILTYLNIKP